VVIAARDHALDAAATEELRRERRMPAAAE
jgi:hypothetical protein